MTRKNIKKSRLPTLCFIDDSACVGVNPGFPMTVRDRSPAGMIGNSRVKSTNLPF
ncbi:hypothetical protein [Candidatus Lokiarchaeum ossiferum]|uniref:hypothetical protein n=1 Tax=Candidatus Lokiarchaeum ossiferum TaxID=2951803 RepID=UPI00352D0F8B